MFGSYVCFLSCQHKVKNMSFILKNDCWVQGMILFLVIITLSLYENCPVVFNLILWLTIQKYELVSCEKSVSFPSSPSLVPTAFPGLWNLVFSFLYILPVFLYENTSKQIWVLFPLFLHECSALFVLQPFFLPSYWHTLEIFPY